MEKEKKELKDIFDNLIKNEKFNFFTLKKELAKKDIKAKYINYQYLAFDYKGKMYVYTTLKNVLPDKGDIIFNFGQGYKYILGEIKK